MRAPSFARTFGGGTLITAVAAARLGTRVDIVTALPEPAAGRLARERIRVRNLRRRGEPHAVSVAFSTVRERAFVTFDGVNDDLESRLLAAFTRRLPAGRHVHFALGPRHLPSWTALVVRLGARGVTTSWDFGWHEALPARRGFAALVRQIDWIFVNEQESSLYTGARTSGAARDRWPRLARNVVVKRGARGAMVLSAGRVVRVPAPAVRVVDTTGAGDAFNGGFLSALLAGAPIDDCARTGAAVGALSTRSAGGLDGLPSASEVAAMTGGTSVSRRGRR